MASDNEKPLQGWKAIAAHLGCSIKTAQHWEFKGLPVHRHPVLGVIGHPAEMDHWVNGLRRTDSNREPQGLPGRESVEPANLQSAANTNEIPAETHPLRHQPSRKIARQLRGCALLGVSTTIFAILLAAILKPAYGLAVLMMWLDYKVVSGSRIHFATVGEMFFPARHYWMTAEVYAARRPTVYGNLGRSTALGRRESLRPRARELPVLLR